MLENIINSVKGQLTGELQNKFQLQPDTASKSVDLAKDSLAAGLKQQASSGDFGGMMDILKGQKSPTEHSGMNSMIGNYVNDLTTKLGVPESIAKQVGPFVISFLMNKVSGKVSADGTSQSDLMGMFGGIKDKLSGGLGDKLGGLFK
ncbi:hypothetical protein [Pontibacter arcticus]|uniref:DUF937 domain-containing protein n=1 Tax=Pontibacter arcticus TaxID=2080288 RepID=A0A364REG3_9BACT|nr:hypothetical protein [Pontibacter arcticus]RAU82635.1 hypothetical protein DP923_09880 [Pontibacter arcticus]